MLTRREHVAVAAIAFKSDLAAGALTGPRLASAVAPLLRELPEMAQRDEPPDVPDGGPPTASHMANLEPLPAAAMCHARAVLCSAAAGAASSKGGKSGKGVADGSAEGLVSLLFAEPLQHKTRMWAAYASRAAAEEGGRAFRALPQISELTDSPQVLRDMLMPAREARAPPPGDEALQAHVDRCDALIEAIEARVGLSGQGSGLLSAAAISALPSHPVLSVAEHLELRVLYLRRVHFFDYLGGGPFASHTALLASRGEAHLPMGVLIHATRACPTTRHRCCHARTRSSRRASPRA